MLSHDEISEHLNNLSSNAPSEKQDEAVRKLKLLNENQVTLLLPCITEQSCWNNLRRVLDEIGYPKIKPIIPDLLELLQDINYSGSKEAANFLVTLGSPLSSYIKEILNGEDVHWKYYVLTNIVEFWDKDLIKELKDELKKISNEIDYENAMHIDALRIRIMNELGNVNEMKTLYNFYVDRYNFFLDKLKWDEKYYK